MVTFKLRVFFTSVSIFSILFSIHFSRYWQGEFVKQSRASLVGDHFLHSRDLNVCFKVDSKEKLHASHSQRPKGYCESQITEKERIPLQKCIISQPGINSQHLICVRHSIVEQDVLNNPLRNMPFGHCFIPSALKSTLISLHRPSRSGWLSGLQQTPSPMSAKKFLPTVKNPRRRYPGFLHNVQWSWLIGKIWKIKSKEN